MEEILTIGQLARMAGVTVRTLHHYDAVGLVTPSARSDSGYRHYSTAEVARLQEILFFRELGLPLEAIKELVDTPDYDRQATLAQHRVLLEQRAEHLLAMLDAVDRAIQAEIEGVVMTNEEMLDVFGAFDPTEHATEAEERWGHSDAYRESARRTAQYSKADWAEIGREAEEINQAFLDQMAAGTAAGNAAAIVDRHREHISKWFYECTPEIHAGLGQMYIGDARFTENIDKAGEGLAHYMADAIAARYRD